MLGLLGDMPTITGSCKDSRYFTASKVSRVAVAVTAMIFILEGTMLLNSPMEAKAVRNSSPLDKQNTQLSNQ